MMNSVPCITTLTGGAATVSAIRALRDEGLEVRSLQEYHAGAAVTSQPPPAVPTA
jgi:carbamoyl-phosphate synthase large subunit